MEQLIELKLKRQNVLNAINSQRATFNNVQLELLTEYDHLTMSIEFIEGALLPVGNQELFL